MLGTESQPGVIPRSVEQIFEAIGSSSAADRQKQFLIRVSYVEIYNETIKDLLVQVIKNYVRLYRIPSSDFAPSLFLEPSERKSRGPIRLQEDKEGNVIMDNLHEISVCKPDDILQIMQVTRTKLNLSRQ